ncbi:cytochrome c oxidase subunit II [Methylocaldum szegediense]|uniref:cytochrome-c oxidase n=1 Tax=Methylocaldum szegediense TaxID=73780 RepID=A0ABN8WWK9_9GAMM|nr:cytochrome c oxidase subunit II [Methylocaldum szegediense]CAI8728664.1 cytochrome c oxidase subunit II [Methylocaldum szegediense]
MTAHRLSALLPALLLQPAAHAGLQSALQPHSPTASDIAAIAWLVFWGATVIFVLVMALTVFSMSGSKRAGRLLGHRRAILIGGFAFPVAVLSALLIYTLRVAGDIVTPTEPPALRIEVVGEKFWWRVNYLTEAGHVDVATANEIHLPAGQLVEFRLRTADVIHSFWVPNLAGKVDMIPGRITTLRVRPDQPGVWRGQCAEYCGAQHANMAFLVVVETPEDFDVWLTAQRQPARPPAAYSEIRE